MPIRWYEQFIPSMDRRGTSYLGGSKPLVFGLQVVHGFVEVVQVPVAKYGIINDVPLPTGVVERVVVSSTREIEPLNAPHCQ